MAQPGTNVSRGPTVYETFMQDQAIPIIYGLGLRDLSSLTLAPWTRMGGRGAFIHLDGMEGCSGMYAVELPPGAALHPERHLYEELVYVVRGRGATEVWKDGSSKRQSFEWQTGSVFAPPINAWHRLINATSQPALLLALTNAPLVMDLFHNLDFVFSCPYDFADRYDAGDDYFRVRPVEWDASLRQHLTYSNIIPDVVQCDLPVDDRRGPGRRGYIGLEMADNVINAHIMEFPSGRYGKAHSHFAGAAIICLAGKGYSITWPCEYGLRPWEGGLGDFVKRQDYVAGGVVSPGMGWFHQHFSIGREPLRLLAFRYGSVKRPSGFTEAQMRAGANVDIKKGGRTIEYEDEDPQIRKDYLEALAGEGVAYDLPASAVR